MKAGVIGLIHGDFEKLESFHHVKERGGSEIRESIEVRQTYTNLSGHPIGQSGRAAVQRVTDSEEVQISDDGSISVTESSELTTHYTEFLVVPGEFVVTRSRAGSFIFDLIESEFDVTIESARLNLKSYASTKPEAEPWKIGFYGKQGNAENGVVHGDQLLNDQELGMVLADSPTNQLGLEYTKGEQLVKIFATESGYVEVYQPNNYDSAEFLNFVSDEIIEHVKTEEDG